MTQYPNTPSIIDLARVPLEGVFEVLAYQFDDAPNDRERGRHYLLKDFHFHFFSFRIIKISSYINFKIVFGRILAPHSGRRPGADAPPAPLATPLVRQSQLSCYVIVMPIVCK